MTNEVHLKLLGDFPFYIDDCGDLASFNSRTEKLIRSLVVEAGLEFPCKLVFSDERLPGYQAKAKLAALSDLDSHYARYIRYRTEQDYAFRLCRNINRYFNGVAPGTLYAKVERL